jgi:1-acyl-sn-glycerol-3-phosphate acyltransferase
MFWPRRTWRRKPGTIIVEVLDPIPPGLPKAEFMRRLQDAIECASDQLMTEAAANEETH